MKRKIRVLISKPGLDGHESGAKLIARALRDAGMEVVYTGMRQTPEAIVKAAFEEDVDVIGLSILSGTHKEHSAAVTGLMKERGIKDTLLLVGGIIPREDIPYLKEIGVAEVFGPGTRLKAVIDFVQKAMAATRS